MKSISAVCLAAAGLVMGAGLEALAGGTTNWVLGWDMPTNGIPVELLSYVPGTNQAYKVYGTTSLALPLANWPVLAVFTNWGVDASVSPACYTNGVSVPVAGQWFFTMTATNVQGESVLAMPVTTGPVFEAARNARLKAGN